MNKNNHIRIGFDRFLAKEWADYAFELFQSSNNTDSNYQRLKVYLQRKISGVDSARKTANQLKRLWLNRDDPCVFLRESAVNIVNENPNVDQTLLHYGLALNVFPIFLIVTKKLGELIRLQETVNLSTLTDRVSQTMVSPRTIPRIISRVIQTLSDWNILSLKNNQIDLFKIKIDGEIGIWMSNAMLNANNFKEISRREFFQLPELLGITIPNIQTNQKKLHGYLITRDFYGEEIFARN